MWKQRVRWKREVTLDQARHPNNVNITKPLMKSAKVFEFNVSAQRNDSKSQTSAVCLQRDCRSLRADGWSRLMVGN